MKHKIRFSIHELNEDGTYSGAILSYEFNTDLPPRKIKDWAAYHLSQFMDEEYNYETPKEEQASEELIIEP
jgi:hypothetical protein